MVAHGKSGVVGLLRRMVRWRIGLRWYAVALLLPAGLALAATVLNVMLGARAPSSAELGGWTGLLSTFAFVLLIPGLGGDGGNEIGRGDKLLGGGASDLVLGQKGDDVLYGQNGGDEVTGGYGHDLVVGGNGEDTLDGGPGSDEINARDGQQDTVVIRPDEYDTIYYDQGLDVLREQTVSKKSTDGSAELTASGTGKAELVAKRPPEGLFAHTGKVLVEHGGEELLIPEGELKGHLGHGDELIDPTGRAAALLGRG
jgi:Ca2+-binding RTX toxin-like protein